MREAELSSRLKSVNTSTTQTPDQKKDGRSQGKLSQPSNKSKVTLTPTFRSFLVFAFYWVSLMDGLGWTEDHLMNLFTNGELVSPAYNLVKSTIRKLAKIHFNDVP